MKKCIKEDYIKYKDIKNELLFTEGESISIKSAYIENGMVCIYGHAEDNIAIAGGVYNFLPAKYAPRARVLATINTVAAGVDKNRINFILIDDDGTLKIWIPEKLLYPEPFSFIYPLKTS